MKIAMKSAKYFYSKPILKISQGEGSGTRSVGVLLSPYFIGAGASVLFSTCIQTIWVYSHE